MTQRAFSGCLRPLSELRYIRSNHVTRSMCRMWRHHDGFILSFSQPYLAFAFHAISCINVSCLCLSDPNLGGQYRYACDLSPLILLMSTVSSRQLPPVHVCEDAIGRSRSNYNEHV